MKTKGLSNHAKGIICILFAAFSFTIMNVFIRRSGALPSFEKAFFRNFMSMIIAFFMLKKNGGRFEVPKGARINLLLRAVFGTVGVVANYYAVDHILMSDASMLAKLSPFYCIFLCWLFLKEKVTAVQVALLLAALGGSVLIVKPSPAIFSQPGTLVAFIGGVFAAMAYTQLRILAKKNVDRQVVVLAFSTFSCLSMIPFMCFDFVMPSLYQLAMLLLAGLFAAGGQYGLTYGYSFAPASEISIYDYFQVIFNAIVGYVLYKEVADRYSLIGYAIIITAAVIMAIYNKKRLKGEEAR